MKGLGGSDEGVNWSEGESWKKERKEEDDADMEMEGKEGMRSLRGDETHTETGIPLIWQICTNATVHISLLNYGMQLFTAISTEYNNSPSIIFLKKLIM